MHTWIALFRGINVGGHHKLPMAELRAQLESMELQDVQTYIQSGNVVFRAEDSDCRKLATRIAGRVEKNQGFRPRVLLLSPEELQSAIDGNPFAEGEAEPKNLHLAFLAAAPANPQIDRIEAALADSERYRLTERVFYLYAPDGIGRSKLASNIERYLGVEATGRNWRTVSRLAELAGA